MEPKKTKLDYFIESYSAYDLNKEAKDVVSSHVQFVKASKAVKTALIKHYGSYFAETFEGIKFQFSVPCHAYVKRAHVVPCFNAKVSTLSVIKDKKQKTLVSRKAKLLASYKGKLASNVASGLVLKINSLLNAYEKASNNLTNKPPRAFFDDLSDVRETLNAVKFCKREAWEGFRMPDSQLMLSMQSTPVVTWLLEDAYNVETCFNALAKFKKSSQADDVVAFGALIGNLRSSLCGRLYDDLNGALLTSSSQEPAPNWLDSVKITDLVQGEYVSVPIGSEDKPVELLSAREEVQRELAETETRLSYALESEACRVGIFAAIKGMTRDLESGLANATDKTEYLISFFNANRGVYLQAFLDRAIAAAIKGKGQADKKHLNDLNSLLTSYSVIATPNNGESKVVGVMGASELVHYVKFICPWLTYKANDGGFVESVKWEGLATAHRGHGFPVIGSGNVCLYPSITLHRYLQVKKTIQIQVRITNRARKRHNESLKPKA